MKAHEVTKGQIEMAVIGGYILNSILFMCQTDVATSADKPDGGDAAVHCGVRRVQRWLSLQHLRGGQLFLLVLMNKVSVFYDGGEQ